MIGDTDSGRLATPPGVQRHIVGDLHGTVGIVRRAGAVSLGVPAQEDHVAVSEAVALDGGLGALGVLLVVGHGAGAAVGIVGHRVTGAVAYLGVQLIVRGDLGARIEGQTAIDRPAQEAVASFERGLEVSFQHGQLIGDGITLADGDRVKEVVVLIIHLHRIGRSHPLGVDGDILGGHSLAGEDIGGAFAQFVVVPGDEPIALFACGCSGGGVGHIGDIRLVLLGHGVLHITAVNKLDLVAVAVVVELSAVVSTSVLRTVDFISGKAGDVIEVLIPGNVGAAHHYRIGMMQRICFSSNHLGSGLALQNLNIVAGAGGTAAFAAGYIEVAAAKRHHIDTCLVGTVTASFSRPVSTAVVAGRPLIADVSAVLGSDGEERTGFIAGAVVGVFFLGTGQLAPQIITQLPPAVGMLFLAAAEGRTVGGPEVDGVLIALVEHIDNGAAVTGNSLLLNPPNIEAIARLCSGLCQLVGGAGHGFGVHKGELSIVHILLPVDHSIRDAILRRPMCLQRNAFVQFAAKGVLSFAVIPTGKIIAGLGGGSGLFRIRAGCEELRLHIAAAVRIKGDPVTLLHLGIQRNVAVLDGHRLDLVATGAIFVGVPAGDGFVGTHGKAHLFKGDLIAGLARLSGDDTAGVVLEVDIVAVLDPGGKLDGIAFSDFIDLAEAGEEIALFIIPAGKHLALFCCRCCRLVQRVAFLYDLRAVRFAAITTEIELIGIVALTIRLDDTGKTNTVIL